MAADCEEEVERGTLVQVSQSALKSMFYFSSRSHFIDDSLLIKGRSRVSREIGRSPI